MHTRASKYCLVTYLVLLIITPFLTVIPGGYCVWYVLLMPFALVPLVLGPRWYRLAGIFALGLTAILVRVDLENGRRWNEKRHERAAMRDAKINTEQDR